MLEEYFKLTDIYDYERARILYANIHILVKETLPLLLSLMRGMEAQRRPRQGSASGGLAAEAN